MKSIGQPGDRVPAKPDDTINVPVIDPGPPTPQEPPKDPGRWGYFEGDVVAVWLRPQRSPFPVAAVVALGVGVCGFVFLVHWFAGTLGPAAQTILDVVALIVALQIALNLRSDHRAMKLTQPFSYVDPDGVRWDVPSGTEIDGASIPRVLWRFIRGPFDAYARDASVPHDFYCWAKTRPSAAVHRMFYRALRNAGCPVWRANIMYLGVLIGGPRFPGSEKPLE